MDRSSKPTSQTKLQLPVPVKPSTTASALGTKKDTKPSPCSEDVGPPTSAPTSAAAANGKAAKRSLELKGGDAASSIRRKKRTSELGSVASAAGEENSHPKKRRKRMSASDDGEMVTDGKVNDGILVLIQCCAFNSFIAVQTAFV